MHTFWLFFRIFYHVEGVKHFFKCLIFREILQNLYPLPCEFFDFEKCRFFTRFNLVFALWESVSSPLFCALFFPFWKAVFWSIFGAFLRGIFACFLTLFLPLILWVLGAWFWGFLSCGFHTLMSFLTLVISFQFFFLTCRLRCFSFPNCPASYLSLYPMELIGKASFSRFTLFYFLLALRYIYPIFRVFLPFFFWLQCVISDRFWVTFHLLLSLCSTSLGGFSF